MGIDRPYPPEYRSLISEGPSLGPDGASTVLAPSPATGTQPDVASSAVPGANSLDELERQLTAEPSKSVHPAQANSLDELEAQLTSADQMDPISGAPTAGSQPVPTQPDERGYWEQSFSGYLSGVNKAISYAVGYPFDIAMDTAARIARQVGSDVLNPETGLPYKPYDVGRSIEEGLMQAGIINRKDLDNLSAKFGYETAKGLMTSIGLIKMAQWAVQLPNLAPFAKSVFDAMAAKPGIAILSEFGAGPGAVIVGDMAEGATSGTATGTGAGTMAGGMAGGRALGLPGKVLGGIAGAVAGGVGGSYLPGGVDQTMGSLTGGVAGGLVAGKLAQSVEGVGKKVAGALTGPARPIVPGEAVFDPSDPSGNAMRVKTFAERQIDGSLKQIDQEIENVISALPVKMVQDPNTGRMRIGNSDEVQRKVLKGLDDAEQIGQKMQGRFWNAVDPRARLNQHDTNVELDNLSAQSSADRYIPEELDRVRKMFETQDPETGQMRPMPTVKQVLGVAIELQAARQAEANIKIREPNQARIDNLATLEQVLYKGIAGNFPSSVEAQQALDFSKRLHSLFGYGQIADIRNALNTRGVPQGNAFEKFMAKPEGTKQAIQAIDDLIAARVPSARTPAARTELTPTERAKLDGLRQSYEDSITTMFREAAEKEGPEGASKFFEKNKASIKPFANLYADLEYTTAHLANHLENRRLVETSAMHRITQEDPEKIVKWLFSAGPKDATKEAVKLNKQFSADPYAEEGFRNMVTKEVFNRAKMADGAVDPYKLRGQLDDPKQRRMLEAVIGADRMGRLDKMADIAIKLEKGDIQPLKQRVGQKFVAPFALAGAFTGRMINQMFGLKSTLQAPAMMSTMFKKAWLDYMRGGDPSELLANAVRDPRWERQLYAKEPVTTQQLADQVTLTRRLLGVEAGISDQMRRAYMNQLDKDDREGNGASKPNPFMTIPTPMGRAAGPLPGQPLDSPPIPAIRESDRQTLYGISKMANPSAFQAAMDAYPEGQSNIEDRRGNKTIQSYGQLIKSMDDYGYSQSPAHKGFVKTSDKRPKNDPYVNQDFDLPLRMVSRPGMQDPLGAEIERNAGGFGSGARGRGGQSITDIGMNAFRKAMGEGSSKTTKSGIMVNALPPDNPDVIRHFGGEDTKSRIFTFEKDGKRGYVNITPHEETKNIKIDGMGAVKERMGGEGVRFSLNDKSGEVWRFGSQGIKEVFSAIIKDNYPWAKTLSADRVTGARGKYMDQLERTEGDSWGMRRTMKGFRRNLADYMED